MKTLFTLIFTLAFILSRGESFSQNAVIDSLEKNLENATNIKDRVKIIEEIAGIVAHSNNKDVFYWADKIKNLSVKENYEYGFVKSYILRGDAFRIIENFDSALYFYDYSLKIMKTNTLKSLRADVLSSMGALYFDTRMYIKAEEHLSKALSINKEIKDFNGEGFCLYYLGVVCVYGTGDVERGIKFTQNAIDVFYKLKDLNRVNSCLVTLQKAYVMQGNFEKAIKSLQEAELKMLESKDMTNIGIVWSNMGSIYKMRKLYDKALEYYEKALKIAKDNKYEQSYATRLYHIASIYANDKFNKRDYKKSKNMLSEALSIYQTIDDPLGKGDVYSLLASIEFDNKNHKKSIEYAEKADSIFLQLNDKESYASVKNIWAECLFELKKVDSALILATEVNKIALENNLWEIKTKSHYLLSKIYSHKKDYKNAYENHIKFYLLNDSLYSAKRDKELSEIQDKYETEKKELENQKLKAETESQNAQIQAQRIGLVALAVVALLIAWLIWFYQNRKREQAQKQAQNAQIEVQNQRLELYNKEEMLRNERIKQKISEEKLAITEERLSHTEEKLIFSEEELRAKESEIQDIRKALKQQISDLQSLKEKIENTEINNEQKMLAFLKEKNITQLEILRRNFTEISEVQICQLLFVYLDIKTLERDSVIYNSGQIRKMAERFVEKHQIPNDPPQEYKSNLQKYLRNLLEVN